MENLHITCDNLEQRQEVFNILDSMGLVNIDNNYDHLQVNARINNARNKVYMTVVNGDVWRNSEVLTHQQFMEKYQMLQQKVTEALATGYTKQTLSLALGHHKQYITRLLQSGIQNERVIQEIDILLGNKIVVDASVLKELDHKNQVLDKRNSLLLNAEDKIEALQAVNAVHADNIELLTNDNQALSSMRITAENKLRKERTISAVIIIIMIFVLIGAWL